MTTRVRIKPRGPIMIEGPIELVDEDGNPVDTSQRPKIAFCRCGASENKPYCDGSHHRVRFGVDPAE